jgi:hypothetical protein
MKTQFLLTALVAFLAGLIGGWASRFLPGPAVAEGRYGTVRAQRFELIDESRKPRAFLGTTTDGMKNTALVFLDRQQKEHAAFGVWANTTTPYLLMKGQEGSERFSVKLAYRTERPVIMLRDEKEYRVQLGFLTTDYPSPGDNSWGLTFHNHDSPHATLSGIGMGPELRKVPLSGSHQTMPAAKMRGYITVRDDSGKEWVPEHYR